MIVETRVKTSKFVALSYLKIWLLSLRPEADRGISPANTFKRGELYAPMSNDYYDYETNLSQAAYLSLLRTNAGTLLMECAQRQRWRETTDKSELSELTRDFYVVLHCTPVWTWLWPHPELYTTSLHYSTYSYICHIEFVMSYLVYYARTFAVLVNYANELWFQKFISWFYMLRLPTLLRIKY